MAVFTKVLDDKEGLVYDELYEMNAWDDPNVRQKPILEDLREFAEEYEADLRRYEQEHGVPPEKSSQNEILKLVEEAEEESRKRKAAVGIQSGQMSAQLEAKKEESFAYASLRDTKLDVWANLQEFYGINSEFPSEYLFYQKNTNNNIVFISDGMTNKFMKSTRKYKLNVVNIGVKMFSKNRDDKSNANVRAYFHLLFIVSSTLRRLGNLASLHG